MTTQNFALPWLTDSAWPFELTEKVFGYLTVAEICELARVDRRTRALLKDARPLRTRKHDISMTVQCDQSRAKYIKRREQLLSLGLPEDQVQARYIKRASVQ
jgi:hypothetical protein